MKRALIFLLTLCMLFPILTCGSVSFAQDAYSADDLDRAQADAASGKVDAMIFLGNLYYLGSYNHGITRDFGKALDWFIKAAEAGDTSVLMNIAKIYERGSAGEKDLDAAYQWYKKAAEAGIEAAQTAMEQEAFRTMRWRDNSGALTGRLGEEEMIINRPAMPLYLDAPVVDCDMISLDLRIVEVKNGWPYGRYSLNAMDLNGKWNLVDYFQIEKFQSDGEPRNYEFHLAAPISFEALAICLAEDGMEFGLTHEDVFLVDSNCLSSYSPSVPEPAFTPSGEEYPFLSSRVSYSAFSNPYF